MARVANTEVPDIFGFVLTCGRLFALHKLSPAEQKERGLRQEDSKIGPVNVGVCFLKWAFKLALNTPEAAEAIERLKSV